MKIAEFKAEFKEKRPDQNPKVFFLSKSQSLRKK